MTFKQGSILILAFLLAAYTEGCGSSPGPTGPQGPIGPQGPAGNSGLQGSAGAPESISSGLSCSHIQTINSRPLLFEYGYDIFASGDVFARCAIHDTFAEYGTSQDYKAGTANASNGNCVLGYDLDTATGGFWDFTSSGATTKSVYTDSGSPFTGTVVTFAANECSSF